jgi:hypothetical protein
MFIAALFTITKLWTQPRCPTTDEWIKKMWHLYTMEFYSATKKHEILSFTSTWMEGWIYYKVKWYSTCLTSMRLYVQSPILPRKEKKKKKQVHGWNW